MRKSQIYMKKTSKNSKKTKTITPESGWGGVVFQLGGYLPPKEGGCL